MGSIDWFNPSIYLIKRCLAPGATDSTAHLLCRCTVTATVLRHISWKASCSIPINACHLAGTSYSEAAMATPVGWSNLQPHTQRSAAWCAPGRVFFCNISSISTTFTEIDTETPQHGHGIFKDSASCITAKTRQCSVSFLPYFSLK